MLEIHSTWLAGYDEFTGVVLELVEYDATLIARETVANHQHFEFTGEFLLKTIRSMVDFKL